MPSGKPSGSADADPRSIPQDPPPPDGEPHRSPPSLPVPSALRPLHTRVSFSPPVILPLTCAQEPRGALRSPCLVPSSVLGPGWLWGRGLPFYLPTGCSEEMPPPVLDPPWTGRKAVPATQLSRAAIQSPLVTGDHTPLSPSPSSTFSLSPEDPAPPCPESLHQPCPLWPLAPSLLCTDSLLPCGDTEVLNWPPV